MSSLIQRFLQRDGAIRHRIATKLDDDFVRQLFVDEHDFIAKGMSEIMMPDGESTDDLLKFKREYARLQNRKNAIKEMIDLIDECNKFLTEQANT